MNLLEKLDYLATEKGLNRKEWAQQGNVPYSTISNYYVRGYENMSLAVFRKICDFFGVTMDSMAYDDRDIEYKSDKPATSYTSEERELINGFQRLDDRGQNAVLDTVRREVSYAYEEKREVSA